MPLLLLEHEDSLTITQMSNCIIILKWRNLFYFDLLI